MTIYIARVNSEGNPESMWTTGVTPDIAAGADPSDNTKTIVHVTADLVDTGSFIATHYYKSSAWHERQSRPGDYYDWKDEAWVLNSDKLWIEIRYERDRRIQITDWTQVADSPLSDAKKAEWASYRVALRDVPTDNGSVTQLSGIVWPDQPS